MPKTIPDPRAMPSKMTEPRPVSGSELESLRRRLGGSIDVSVRLLAFVLGLSDESVRVHERLPRGRRMKGLPAALLHMLYTISKKLKHPPLFCRDMLEVLRDEGVVGSTAFICGVYNSLDTKLCDYELKGSE
jgi:hypothetical protein